MATATKNPVEDILYLYFREIEDCSGLTPAEEAELARRIRAGDEEAFQKLVWGNLRFVVSVAKDYNGLGLTMIELISAGNMGLMMAAKRFDEKRGFKFISYAVHWVRQAMLQALAEEPSVVHVPINVKCLRAKLVRVDARLSQELGRLPDEEDMVQRGGFKKKSQVKEVITSGQRHISLDEQVQPHNDDSRTFLDVLIDQAPPADEVFEVKECTEHLNRVLDTVIEDARERKIIRRYFGLDGAPAQTLEQIGADFRLTRERIRQIKNRALERLRFHFSLKNLERK